MMCTGICALYSEMYTEVQREVYIKEYMEVHREVFFLGVQYLNREVCTEVYSKL